MPKNKFYITTSIAYTNAPPHIGFALELIQADVLARYHRDLGQEVFFLTGTDEHGSKVEKAAKKENLTPIEFVNKISNQFYQLTKSLNISNTDFIRTTDKKRHLPAVQKVWRKLEQKGDIYKKKYKGLYCSGCEAFLTQKDLVDGKCPIHNIEPQIIEEENYFFRLSKYQSQLEKLIRNREIQIIPKERENEVLSFIKQGLEDISFSRSIKNLKWGIPVPGDKNQTIYVWCDALTNYISALGYTQNSEAFQKFWPADIHCIGKDILRFHAIYWPAMLLSLNLPLPKTILVHGFITSGGQKMSKSLGNVVDPFELVIKYGADALRYYLLREIPSTKDGDFTIEKFEERYNADLAKGLGNLVARVITLVNKAKTKNPKPKSQNPKVDQAIDKTKKNYEKALEEFKFDEALKAIWELIGFCDKYIEKERPWENINNKLSIINDLLFVIKEIAKLLEPFLSETSQKIFEQLKTRKPEPLFPRLD